MDKAQLRRQLRMRLHALGDEERRTKSLIVCYNLIDSIDWSVIQRVSCYQSKDTLHEVDTKPIVNYIHDNWRNTTLDLVQPDNAAAIPRARYDLIIVPVLGFDYQLNRLGRGGGWYDRFLSTQSFAKKIGLAFDLQLVDTIPIEDFDIELDDIVTEDKTTYGMIY